MKLAVDEDLTPRLAATCHAAGYEATAVRDRGKLGSKDRTVAEIFIDAGWVFVTNNVDDYLKETKQRGIHYGLVFMGLDDIPTEQRWLQVALDHIEQQAARHSVSVDEFMTNRVIEVYEDGSVDDYEWPPES